MVAHGGFGDTSFFELSILGCTCQAYSPATLGVYEMNRVELLRDLYVWAYERSTQEYLAIKLNMPLGRPCTGPRGLGKSVDTQQ